MRTKLLLPLFVAAAALGCERPAIQPQVAPGKTLETLTVTSKTFSQAGKIPIDSTCDGKEKMPDVVWSAPPEGTKSLVVLIDDPDASGGVFTHLLIYDVPPDVHGITDETDVRGGTFGLNDFKATRYNGPCPPKGEAHRYRFKVLAIDVRLGLREGLTRNEVDQKIDGHLLGEGTLTGVFGH
jgi:hypothetical protein